MKPARGEDIQVDPEFAAMIPPLAADELAQLAASIQHDGCRDPLIVWKGTHCFSTDTTASASARSAASRFGLSNWSFPTGKRRGSSFSAIS
jgi:hypothetical protein